MNAVEAINISHSYVAERDILKNINFELPQNSALGILGRSGCGKSTLANIICGLISPNSGKVKIFGENLSLKNLNERKKFYKILQIAFQDAISAVNPSFSVFETIREPLLYLSDLNKNQIRDRAVQLLEFMDLSANFLDKRALNLSGGELQRVCLARALAIKPRILILDETLSSLDLTLQAEILQMLGALKNEISFLFITHDIRLARAFCDDILLLENGVVAEKIKSSQSFTSKFGRELQSFV